MSGQHIYPPSCNSYFQSAGLLEYGSADVTYAHSIPNCTLTRKDLAIERLEMETLLKHKHGQGGMYEVQNSNSPVAFRIQRARKERSFCPAHAVRSGVPPAKANHLASRLFLFAGGRLHDSWPAGRQRRRSRTSTGSGAPGQPHTVSGPCGLHRGLR